MRILSLAAGAVILATTATLATGVSAEPRGYYVAPTLKGEFRSMRCLINGTPVNSRRACARAAYKVRTNAGWAQARGPGVTSYIEIGIPRPLYGGRFRHSAPVYHQHQVSGGTYSHHGYLGHHQLRGRTGNRLKKVHTGGASVEIISGSMN